MINSIQISNVATFGESTEKIDELSKFNYFFGANGTGKTTISRIIENESAFPECNITWERGTKLKTLVYNSDFVEKNFDQSTELKGVFTLGEENVQTRKQIQDTKNEIDDLTRKVEGLTYILQGDDGKGGKKEELEKIKNKLRDKCWAQKQKYDDKFAQAFKGFRGDSKKFMKKVLLEFDSNTQSMLSLEKLEEKAETLFGSNPTPEELLPTLETKSLLKHETNQILQKVVIGKDDVDIAAMINKLGNSDWVKEGRSYYEVNNGICPFCQQETTESFARSLNEYFDETFENDIKSIDDLVKNCELDYSELQKYIVTIISSESKFLDVEKLKTKQSLLDSKIALNLQKIKLKKEEPSRVIELESIRDLIVDFKNLISVTNDKITTHNKMVANLSKERQTLTSEVWKYLIEQELKSDLEKFKSDRKAIDQAIQSLEKQIRIAHKDITQKTNDLQTLERNITSIKPTIDGINNLLKAFGFVGFILAEADKGSSYKLIRSDGMDAKKTLSEGEKNFVTFLYFYHLLKGSISESGIAADRVVVFDDPVSSFDSDILFIVSSLIRGIFDELRKETGYIKQIFVLTHNVYFHKEITFNKKRGNIALNEETFWIVRKIDSKSKVMKHPTNPIQTSYELLWSEVKDPNRSNLTIQNTLRRIIENYFTILGGIDPYDIYEMFEGRDRLICKSLFSWVNAGSHAVYDDLYISIDNTTVETYLRVFEEIFDKSQHKAHYNMMMGINDLE